MLFDKLFVINITLTFSAQFTEACDIKNRNQTMTKRKNVAEFQTKWNVHTQKKKCLPS